MPVYDYRCIDCNSVFSVMVSNQARERVRCPRCGSPNLKSGLSVVSPNKTNHNWPPVRRGG